MLRVDWSEANSVSDLALLGNTRTCLARRHIRHAPLETLDHYEVLILSLTLFFVSVRSYLKPPRPLALPPSYSYHTLCIHTRPSITGDVFTGGMLID